MTGPMDLSRRDFLAAGAATALGVACSAPAGERPGKREVLGGVVVLGGGLAGLAAAQALLDGGEEVLVLEARERPGGRVLTLREPFLHGQYAEAGALYVPAAHEVTRRACQAHGIELVDALPADATSAVAYRGRLLWEGIFSDPEWTQALTEEERTGGMFGLVRSYILPGFDELGDLAQPDFDAPTIRHLDDVSFADLLRERGASEAAVEFLGMGYYGILGDGIESVSALQTLRDSWGQRGPRTTYRIQGGSDALPRAMAQRLSGRIRYGAVLTGLEHGPYGVRAHYLWNGAPYVTAGRYAVCTLPPPAVKNVVARPELSAVKREALNVVGMTSVTRTFLQCSERFWQPAEAPVFSIATDLEVQTLHDATLMQPGDGGILESYATGANARDLDRQEADDRVLRVRDSVDGVFPGSAATFERGASKSWDADPWAGGGYAAFRPGALRLTWEELRRPEGRIHFAGEHTSAWSAWMQGALESGERAAGEILARIAAGDPQSA